MGDPAKADAIGEWTFSNHRMARFDQGRIYAWVHAKDEQGAYWTWTVLQRRDGTETRVTGEQATALQAAQAADAADDATLTGVADPVTVEQWSTDHLRWMGEADQADTAATVRWEAPRSDD